MIGQNSVMAVIRPGFESQRDDGEEDMRDFRPLGRRRKIGTDSPTPKIDPCRK